MGRPPVKPSINDPEAIERLCEYLATGMSVKKACDLPDVPNRKDFYVRLAKDEEFVSIIARARAAQAGALIDVTIDMADKATPDNWQVVRLQIWTRQWYASKVAAKTYGDKLQHANAAGDGNTEIIYRWEEKSDDG